LQLVGFILRFVAGDNLERTWRDGDVLATYAEETAHADDERLDLSVLVEQYVAHITDLFVVGTNHVRALELRSQKFIRLLRGHKLGRPAGSGLSLTWRGRRRIVCRSVLRGRRTDEQSGQCRRN